jgi:hypothetical protein
VDCAIFEVWGKIIGWSPHQDSNLELSLRRALFYPVKLWGDDKEAILLLSGGL